MPTKFFKPAVQLLERHGYTAGDYNARRDSTCWQREGAPDVMVYGAITEVQFRSIRRAVEKRDGVASVAAVRKRDTAAIKQRRTTQRERAAAERDRRVRELDEYRQSADARMGSLTTREWRAICAEVERRQREIRRLERIMSQAPDTSHRGVEHAKHRA